MKKLYTLLALISFMSFANADEELADTVNSFMVESYNKVLNVNVLSEICAIEEYLNINTKSSAYQKKLSENIKRFANLANKKNVNENLVRDIVTRKFKSFTQGVRYGGFIADSFARSRHKGDLCTPDVRKEVAISIRDFSKQKEYYLE